MMMDTNKYKKSFSEPKLWGKIARFGKQIGSKGVYSVLLLYFAYKRTDTPRWAKNIIIGVVGYFISPIDLIPDLTPFIGYTDDLKLLAVAVGTLAAYINPAVKTQAREKLESWNLDIEGDVNLRIQ